MNTAPNSAVAAEKQQPENGCVTFKEAAEAWLKSAVKRRRKPIRESTLPTIKSGLKLYVYPSIGSLPLERVNNKTVKACVEAMQAEGLSSSTQSSYIGFIKRIMKSVLNDETGEPLHLRHWSSEVMDLPEVEHTKTPCLTKEQIEGMMEEAKDDNEHLLYLILGATGLRIGEALGLEWHHLKNNCRTLEIVQKVNRHGRIEKELKTKSGRREVDLPEWIADILVYWSRNMTGLMFPSKNGTPWRANNLAKRRLGEHFKGGWHAFRRFRETHLSAMSCNHDLQLYWLGHKPATMSEIYSKLSKDLEFRLKEAERVGTGFGYAPMLAEPITVKIRRPRRNKKTLVVTQLARKSSSKLEDAINAVTRASSTSEARGRAISFPTASR